MDETQRPGGAPPDAGEPTIDMTAATSAANEPAAAVPVATSPVAPAAPARSRGAIRWGIALGVVAVLLAVTAVGAVILTGGTKASSVQGWLPPGTLAYLELRADLPGDQRQNLSDFLAKFPGFKDQAALDQKLDTLFDELFDQADISYTAEIKPWLQGEVGLAVTTDALPEASALGGALGGALDPGQAAAAVPTDGLVILAATTDPEKARAWIVGEVQGTPRTETYAGVELNVIEHESGASMAWAVTDTVLVAGTEGTVKAALDTGGQSPVASSDSFASAKKTASGDYLAFAYVDAKALTDWAMSMVSALPAGSGIPAECLQAGTGATAGWLAAVTRVEADALVADLAAPAVAGVYDPKNAASEAATRLPATSVFYTGSRQVGDALVGTWAELKKQLECLGAPAGTADQIDGALAIVGGIEGLVGWADDLGIAVTADGTTWGGGLVLTSADPADPKRTADQLGSLLALAGGQGLDGVTVGTETYGDGTIYTIKTGSDMAAVTLAFSGQRGILAAGTVEFVKAVVDTTEASSLASVDRYRAAIARAGGDGTGELYVDIAGIRDRALALMPAESRATYDAEVAPYLAPLDTLAMVARAGDPDDTVRLVMTVK